MSSVSDTPRTISNPPSTSPFPLHSNHQAHQAAQDEYADIVPIGTLSICVYHYGVFLLFILIEP